MTNSSDLTQALGEICRVLTDLGRNFALVGGLAVSVRSDIRFTRDIDIVVEVSDDADAKDLVFHLRQKDFQTVATVEQSRLKRLATARLETSAGIAIDLIFANCGIEREIVNRATIVELSNVGPISIASAEELLAMKILSMSDIRLQDRIDAQNLIVYNPYINFNVVKDLLKSIEKRGYHRDQNLQDKLIELLSNISQE